MRSPSSFDPTRDYDQEAKDARIDAPRIRYEDLEQAYRDGKATMPVNHINHREFVMDGKRYIAGWSSEGVAGPGDSSQGVIGWIVGEAECEL